MADKNIGAALLACVWTAGTFGVAHYHGLWFLLLLLVPFIIFVDRYAVE